MCKTFYFKNFNFIECNKRQKNVRRGQTKSQEDLEIEKNPKENVESD